MNEKSEALTLTDRKTPSAPAAHIDELLDEALKQTFPASDSVAIDIERRKRSDVPPPASQSSAFIGRAKMILTEMSDLI
jgi:hypothetical protein